MTNPKPLTALEKISELSILSYKARCYEFDSQKIRVPLDLASRYDGENYAFNTSYFVMKRELERLKNLFQNGALTIEDFGVY